MGHLGLLIFLLSLFISCGNTRDGLVRCPSGFVSVPGETTLGTTSFCVAAYEMKEGATYAVSRPEGLPWTSISAHLAYDRCAELGDTPGPFEDYEGEFALISNIEWMSVARNIESVASNWRGQQVGSGVLGRGHTDASPSNSLELTNLSDPYNATGNNGNENQDDRWQQRRAFTLSNGNIVWDFAGNVTEWVDWDISDRGFTRSPMTRDAINSYDSLADNIHGIEAVDLGSAASSRNASSGSLGLGRWRGGGTDGRAATRGGHFSHGDNAGIYHLVLDNTADNVGSTVGFRCVYRPSQ